jgi:hypothetical protein
MQNLARNVIAVIDDDAASVDEFKAAAIVLGGPVYAVARNARRVAYNRAALSSDSIKESGLSDVGPAHNDHCGSGVRH